MNEPVYSIRVRKGETVPRYAQVRRPTADRALLQAADVTAIKLRIEAGVGEGPREIIFDQQRAPAPGPLAIADLVKDTPITGAAWLEDTVGANFTDSPAWDLLAASNRYEGHHVYREIYELDCRTAGYGLRYVVFLVTVLPNAAPITP